MFGELNWWTLERISSMLLIQSFLVVGFLFFVQGMTLIVLNSDFVQGELASYMISMVVENCNSWKLEEHQVYRLYTYCDNLNSLLVSNGAVRHVVISCSESSSFGNV